MVDTVPCATGIQGHVPACPGPHLLGLQEVGVPQLTDDHLTLLHCGGFAQVRGQAQ